MNYCMDLNLVTRSGQSKISGFWCTELMSNSDEIRWIQRLENFDKALARLTEACGQEVYSDLERAGLVQTFTFCFELSWNALKDLLFYEGFNVTTPRAVIRKSFEFGYIDEEDCEILIQFLKKRNILSHAYRKNVALEAETLIKEHYYPVLLRLHTVLSEKVQK